MERELIGVEEHNRRKAQSGHSSLNATGVACPDCGKALWRTGTQLLSMPPQWQVVCEGCGKITSIRS